MSQGIYYLHLIPIPTSGPRPKREASSNNLPAPRGRSWCFFNGRLINREYPLVI